MRSSPAPSAPVGSRPRRYLDLARSYAEEACRLAAIAPDRPSAPLYMLVAHGMELGLKAVIAGGRCDDEGLILLGHDLPLCLRAAVNEGLELDPGGTIEAMVEALAMPHLAQVLRYPARMSLPLPDPNHALDALETLLSRVDGRIGARQAAG